MATAQYQMPMPPAGTYPWREQQPPVYLPQGRYSPPQQSYPPSQQGYYTPPQYQQQYPQRSLAPPPYPQQTTPYPSEGRAPPPPPSEAWPNQGTEYMGPGYKYGSYQDDTPDYNNPPEPQYGVPEHSHHGSPHQRSASPSQGGDPRFVFPENGQEGQPGQEGERGLGATVLGGGAGAFLGHKMGHGAMGTIGGLALGAIAANAFEHHEKKKKEERRESRAFDEGYNDGERRSMSRASRSRDIDDDSYYSNRYDRYEDDEDEYYEPPRHHHHHHHHDYDDGNYYRDDDYYREDSYYRRDDY